MRVLFISKEGDGLGVAQRFALEGNEVDVWIKNDRFKLAGIGIVNRVPSWQGAARKADLIIADCVGLGKYDTVLAGFKKPLLGVSRHLDAIELDRDLGMQLFERAKITIPETYRFASITEAKKIPHTEGFNDGWVVKPDGNISTSKTMVVKDESLWDESVTTLPNPCTGILQRVVSGIEISTEGWFNGRDWIHPFNHTFEEKRFLAGDLGENTGCMGNVVVNAGSGNKLTKQTIERIGGFLSAINYRGPVDINCIVNEKGAYALEITSRMGYDAVEALIEGLEEPSAEFMFGVANGTQKRMNLTNDTMIAVRLSIPPWPMRRPEKTSEGSRVLGIDGQSITHLFLTDLQKKGNDYLTAGGDGVLLKATAIGRVTRGKVDPKGRPYKDDYTYEARRRVYRTLDRIKVSSKQYRIDIGERVNGDIAKLKEWGWL